MILRRVGRSHRKGLHSGRKAARLSCFARGSREFTRLKTPGDAFGIRITGVPLSDNIRIKSVYRENDIINEFAKPTIKVCRQGTSDMDGDLKSIFWNYNYHPSPWRPILRATRAEDNDTIADRVSRTIYYYELSCDGLVETGFLTNRLHEDLLSTGQSHPFSLYSDVPVSEFASLAVWANSVRIAALAPSTEYAIEVEVCTFGGSISVTRGGIRPLAELPPNLTVFPHYSLGDPQSICNLSSGFERDFWNYLGKDIGTLQGALSIKLK